MADLKEKVLHALKNRKELEYILNELKELQKELIKNHSNSVLKGNIGDKILNEYNNIQKLGEALYRYSTLKEQNYSDAAEKEKENIENILSKGSISDKKYIWHSEKGEHTCKKCKELDGRIFDKYDKIPEKPHPNCKCTVEVIENDNFNNKNSQNESGISLQIADVQNNQAQEQKWIMPCEGRISSGYGWRIHPIYKTKKWHNGIDIANNQGTIIKAPAAGKAYYAGYESQLNGNTIRIDHGFINGTKVESVYIHLQGFNIKSGDNVKQGQIIGFMGSTGNSTGPHLHFSIYENKRGNDVNPFKYIDKSKY